MIKKELDLGHDDCNTSNNESFENVLAQRMSRRDVMKMGAGFVGTALFGSFMIGCKDDESPATSAPAAAVLLGFSAVPKSIADTLSVPAGYTSKVIFATGDPIKVGVSAYKNDGTDSGDFENRSGDDHDGMTYFGLKNDNTGYDATNSKNGLLCMNHEYINQNYLHTAAEVAVIDKAARIAAQVDKEIAAHGVAIVKVTDSGSGFAVDKSSGYNRRITGATPIALKGAARGNVLVQTAYSTNGTMTRGTLNNCAVGSTPWGTFLTCEENWAGYFKRDSRTGKEEKAMSRYGVGTSSRYGWESVYPQFSASITGIDATADYRNVANTQGYVVEIDPFSPTSTSIKRTSMGRFAHETASLGKVTVGKPVVFYMGDDAKGEYIYKFVSTQNWDAADANGGLSAGDKYLDAGTLYAAKFNADGTGQWLKIDISETAISTYSTYSFADAADVAVHTRLAADAMGATKMDRPEWAGVHPTTGEGYMTLTNNSDRGKSGKYGPDAANPRYYTDAYESTTTNKGNVNGHIIRWKETGGDGAATTFSWDIYLFGAQSDANGTNVNISGLTDDNDFSSPDGLWFSEANKGLMWIQTDDGAYTDVTNCMMLAAVPGNVGDGASYRVVANTAVPTNGDADESIATFVGKDATASTLKRFLVGPRDCEITGIAETPDGKTIFVNVQHPGEEGTSTSLTSHWPDGGTSRPRSATVVITKNDGGVVGY
jgi:secreted PhoX family phosphatase